MQNSFNAIFLSFVKYYTPQQHLFTFNIHHILSFNVILVTLRHIAITLPLSPFPIQFKIVKPIFLSSILNSKRFSLLWITITIIIIINSTRTWIKKAWIILQSWLNTAAFNSKRIQFSNIHRRADCLWDSQTRQLLFLAIITK